MKRFPAARPSALAVLACLCLVPLLAAPVRAADDSTLADSVVLARVDDRVIRVADFIDRYMNADPSTRPATDSTGRVMFLQSMVDKELLGLTARSLKVPLQPFDQLMLKQFETKLLAFIATKRRVRDQVVVTDKELRDLYAEQASELRLRYMLFADEATAGIVHSQLLRGRITWHDAAARYSIGPDSLKDGDMGWRGRSGLPGAPLVALFKLRPPGISAVVRDNDGYKIWQCLGRRPTQMPAYMAIRRALLIDLRGAREAALDDAFMAELSAMAKPVYDTTAVVWLAEKFNLANQGIGVPGSTTVDLRSRVPVLSDADTSRVMASAGGNKLTCGRLITAYKNIPPMGRQRIGTPAALFQMIQRMALEPWVVRYARAQGLERDPEYLKTIDRQREGAMVQHLYEDSVQARITVTEAMRREFYEANRRSFVTRERVQYALIPRMTEAGVDSVMARLKAGETPQAILAEDATTGMTRGSIREALEGQPHAYHGLLFEELHQGESGKQYLSVDNLWVVFYIIAHETPKPIPYAEARDLVDQSLEEVVAERVLNELLDRLRSRHQVEMHPELTWRISLIDHTDEWTAPPSE